MKTVCSIIYFEMNISSHINKKANQVVTTIMCRMMKCCPSFIITQIYIKIISIGKFLAKIQISFACCNMKTVLSSYCFGINISYFISEKLNQFKTTISRRKMKCCPPSLAISTLKLCLLISVLQRFK